MFNKSIKGLCFYIIYNLLLSAGGYFVMLAGTILALMLYDFDNAVSDNGLLVFFTTVVLTSAYIIFKFVAQIITGIIIIKKSKNPLLLKIYNNNNYSAKIILSLFIVDIFIFILIKLWDTSYNFLSYFILYSLTLTFLPSFIVTVINNFLKRKI